MSDTASAAATLPVALVYGDTGACEHLRSALAEFNADIVYDSTGSELDRTALGNSGARVAVVNLDDVLDPDLDDVYTVLETSGCRVVFNDPASSVDLEGWERARWVRHLAAKLRDDVDVDPPRPVDAEPVDVAEAANLGDQWLDDALGVLASDEDIQAAAPTEPAPSPGVDLGAVQIPGDDIEDDLASDFDFTAESAPATTDAADAPNEGATAADNPLDDRAFDFELELPDLSDPASVADVDPVSAQGAAATDVTDPDEPSWDDVEQQLNSSFDGEHAAHVEEATHAAAADAKPAAATGANEPDVSDDAGLHVDSLSIDWSLLDDASVAASESSSRTADDVAEGLDAMFDRAQPGLEDDPGDFEVHAEAPAGGADDDDAPDAGQHAALPPSSQWTLVDDTIEQPPSGRADPDQPSATSAPGDAVAATLADRDFGIELVDPIEYLAPEAPPRETELYTAPELMSMSEALAPQQIDENIHAEAVAEPLPRVVVMAASIGGPDAVREFLSGLPADFPAVFILTQHMGREFIDLMVKQLGKSSAMPVRVPVSGERASAGQVLVVPNGAALTMSRKGAITLSTAPESGDQEPSIRATMGMAAKAFGADTLAIIFSGMVADAVVATGQVVEHGGLVWVQDSASCVVSTMVDSVTGAGMVNFSATPALLAERLIEQFAKESAP